MRRLVLGSLAIVVGFVFVAGASAQGEVTAIIEKAVTAHGGAEKINKMKGVQSKSKGKLELFGGVDMTQEVIIKYTGKFKEVADLDVGGQKVNVISIFDGTKASITANGQAVDVTDKIMEELKEAAYVIKIGRLTGLMA